MRREGAGRRSAIIREPGLFGRHATLNGLNYIIGRQQRADTPRAVTLMERKSPVHLTQQ